MISNVSCVLLTLLVLTCAPGLCKETGCPHERRSGVRGWITSPNYPQPYDMNTCHEWFIQGDQHDVITISIQDLDVPTLNVTGCQGDSFLHLGPDPSVFVCGNLDNQVPKVYISRRDHVWIKFQGSGRILGRGFNLYYVRGRQPYMQDCLVDEFRCNKGKCIPKRWQCNGADECGDGSDEEVCRDGIRHPTTLGPWDCGQQRFGCFDAKKGGYVCHWNFRRCDGIRDCKDGEDELRCETMRHVCSGVMEGPSGYIASPNYPDPYPVNIDCEWLVHVTYGRRIQLRFKDFTLENHYDTDYVIVYDGGSNNADVIGQFYGGNKPPPLIESTDNRLFIQFHSNKDSPEKGFNASYQMKGHCLPTQSKCEYGENDCYGQEQRCDGTWDCKEHGGDERGCGNCAGHLFLCKEHQTQCYAEADHCNGISHCRNNHDEENCTPSQCGPHNGTFLCTNRRCIYESWRCDGTDDCQDGSDEMHCYRPSVKVITAAVIGSLICGLLLVIALGCTCKLYALRLHEAHANMRFTTPISRLTEEMFARRMAPPPYNEAMLTSRPFEEAHQEYLEQLQRGRAPRSQGRRGRHHSRSNQGQGRSVQGQSQGQPDDTLIVEDDDDVALIDITDGGVRHQGSQVDGSHNNPGYLSSDCDGDDSDSTCDPSETSNVNISLATGMSAQWRRGRRKTRPRGGTGMVPENVEFAHVLRGRATEHSTDQQGRDTASIETAASASTDSVIISVDDNAKVEDDVPPLPADPEVPLPLQGLVFGDPRLGHTGSDGESEEGSDSADPVDTEESVIQAEVHSDTRPANSR